MPSQMRITLNAHRINNIYAINIIMVYPSGGGGGVRAPPHPTPPKKKKPLNNIPDYQIVSRYS